MINWLLDPLMQGVLQRSYAAAILVGILCSIVGCYVVLRSMAFLGDGLAHAILPGVAIALMLGGSLLVGALIAGIIVALGIGFFSRQGALKEDTAIGILFTAALALGVALISKIRTNNDLTHILFGDVLAISAGDLWMIGGVSAAILVTLLIFYRPFLVLSFDPVLAVTLRLPVNQLRYLLLVLIALCIVVSIQAVGVALAAAMLVTPAATAYLLTRRLPAMMTVAAASGAFSSVAGMHVSYYLDIPSGAAIVLTATVLFLLAFFFAPQRGLIWQVKT